MTNICDRFVIGRAGPAADIDHYPDSLREMRASGYHAWEFGCQPDHSPAPPTPGSLPVGRLSIQQRRRLRQAFGQFDFVCGHAAFWHNEGVSLLFASRALREASIAVLEETIDFAADLGAHAVCIHIGRNFLPPEQIDVVLRHSLGAVLDRADRRGVTIALENVADEITGTLDSFAGLVTDIGHPRLKILLDVGHTTFAPRPSDERPTDPSGLVADFIRAHGDDIVEMHLHDNDTAGDRHWPVGRGVIDWARVARAIVDSHTPAALMIESGEPDEARRALEEYLREALST